MESFGYFLRLYEVYHKELLEPGKNSLRPAKSVTRNIFTAVDKFVKYYKEHGLVPITVDIVHCDMLGNPPESNPHRTTANDNIYGMRQLNFLTEKHKDGTYNLTDNFVKFCASGTSLKDYILTQMRLISSVSDISMLFNYILCTLKEGIMTKGFYITEYPESASEFIRVLPDFGAREKLCEKIFNIYGFHGRNERFGTYTPNINYRILSTCKDLGLIEPCEKVNEYGFKQFRLTNAGISLIAKINENIRESHSLEDNEDNEELIKEIEEYTKTKISRPTTSNSHRVSRHSYRDYDDSKYQNEVEDIDPDKQLSEEDLPKIKPNNLIISRNHVPSRDPKVAANAKKRANYKCEYDCNHTTFNDRKGHNYCEAHHLIPISVQNLNKFPYSLDVEANVVSLCPTCHARIHHSNDKERDAILLKLYEARKERLHNCGIDLSSNELISFYNDETIKK